MPVKNYCDITKSSGSSGKELQNVDDFPGQRKTTWFIQKGVKPSDTLCWLSIIWAQNATACSSIQLGTELQQ